MAKEYNITKTSGRCAGCERELSPGEEYVATVREADEDAEEQFAREDFCTACWAECGAERAGRADVFGVWRTRMGEPREKKKTFVDDDVLINFFQRLDGADEPAKVQFRFVLGLILMRKKLLIYERSDPAGEGHDVWTVRLKGSEERLRLIDPKLDEEKIADVSRHLSDVLEGEL